MAPNYVLVDSFPTPTISGRQTALIIPSRYGPISLVVTQWESASTFTVFFCVSDIDLPNYYAEPKRYAEFTPKDEDPESLDYNLYISGIGNGIITLSNIKIEIGDKKVKIVLPDETGHVSSISVKVIHVSFDVSICDIQEKQLLAPERVKINYKPQFINPIVKSIDTDKNNVMSYFPPEIEKFNS